MGKTFEKNMSLTNFILRLANVLEGARKNNLKKELMDIQLHTYKPMYVQCTYMYIWIGHIFL